MIELIGTTRMWNPLVMVAALLLILLVVYLIRSMGNKKYAVGTAQVKPFWSGNLKEPEGTLGANDLYWGFMDAFGVLWKHLVRMHTGNINDYIGAFVVMLALLLMIILLL